MEGPSKYAVSEDDTRRTSTFYHSILYRRHPTVHPDQGETALRRLDKKFELDSKRVEFNAKTFCEEFFAHMIAVIIGPFSMPLVYLLSGWKVALLPGFAWEDSF